jgi:DNA replication and repair protein RecF
MRLNHLVLRNFRNYVEAEVDFTTRVNLIVGDNAQGKTTLLEAIYFLSTAKSHRTYPDDELIRHNEQWFYLKGVINAAAERRENCPTGTTFSEDSANALMTIEASNELNGKKRFKLNGNLQPKLSQWIGQFNVVFFSPESLSLVKGAPTERRRFIDILISQIDPTYLNCLQSYQFALRQRNELLKQIRSRQASVDLLDTWNDLIIADGVSIVQSRSRVLTRLNVYTQAKHATLTGNSEKLKLTYLPAVEGIDFAAESEAADLFRRGLEACRTHDILRGTTLLGPHRDDFTLLLESYSAGAMHRQDARAFGSQGQQRTIALSIKLGELELIREETCKTPVVLFDDVFSELDDVRSAFLFELLQRMNAQTFITSTRQERSAFGDCRVLTVQDGKIRG